MTVHGAHHQESDLLVSGGQFLKVKIILPGTDTLIIKMLMYSDIMVTKPMALVFAVLRINVFISLISNSF